MTTTIDGVPWRDAQVFDGVTYREWNERALTPASRREGFCLCYHPMSGVIDFTGMECALCDQLVTDQSAGPEAKRLRTAATLEAFPELRKKS